MLLVGNCALCEERKIVALDWLIWQKALDIFGAKHLVRFFYFFSGCPGYPGNSPHEELVGQSHTLYMKGLSSSSVIVRVCVG